MENGEIQRKYPAEEARKFSPEQRQVLSLRTLDLAEISVPEKPQLLKAVPEVLCVSDISYTYKRKLNSTLSGISFSVQMHEIIGLVGANGCGKTTLGKLIAGLYRPSGGKIALFGKLQNPKKLQKQVLFIMQEAEFQFFTNSVLHELQYGHSVTPKFEKRTEALLKSMDMWDCRDRHPFSLSGGQMQRLTLMTAYLSDKPIVILDEPTAGQDAESLVRCTALIREMRKKKTVLIITHDLELIAGVCDRCIGLSDGQIETEFFTQTAQDLQTIRRYIECFHPAEAPPKKKHKELFHPVTKLIFWITLGLCRICCADFADRRRRLVRNGPRRRYELRGIMGDKYAVSKYRIFIYTRIVSAYHRHWHLYADTNRAKRGKPHACSTTQSASAGAAHYDCRRDFSFFSGVVRRYEAAAAISPNPRHICDTVAKAACPSCLH